MHVGRSLIPQELVSLALTTPEEYLHPGAEDNALEWITTQKVENQSSDGRPSIWFLSDLAIMRFASDLTLPTPECYAAAKDHRLSRYGILQLALATTIGLPYGIEGHRNGVILQDVFPKSDLIDRPNSSMGAHLPFNLHTDQAFSTNPDERPDSVALACVRNIEMASTGLIDLEPIVPLLSQEAHDRLSATNFSIYRGRREEAIGVDYSAVLFNRDGQYSVRLGSDTFGADHDDNKALQEFRGLLAKNIDGVILQPGEILTFPNATTVHYRDSFEPANAAADRRWIQKSYIRYR